MRIHECPFCNEKFPACLHHNCKDRHRIDELIYQFEEEPLSIQEEQELQHLEQLWENKKEINNKG